MSFTPRPLLLLIALLLPACASNLPRPTSAPLVPCALPPVSIPPPYPTGEICHGTEEQRRACYKALVESWAIHMFGLIQLTAESQAAHTQCLDALRKDGVIR